MGALVSCYTLHLNAAVDYLGSPMGVRGEVDCKPCNTRHELVPQPALCISFSALWVCIKHIRRANRAVAHVEVLLRFGRGRSSRQTSDARRPSRIVQLGDRGCCFEKTRQRSIVHLRKPLSPSWTMVTFFDVGAQTSTVLWLWESSLIVTKRV